MLLLPQATAEEALAVFEVVERTDVLFTVRLSSASVQDIRLNFATADGTATANLDYIPTSGTVTIPAGATTATIRVSGLGDHLEIRLLVEDVRERLAERSVVLYEQDAMHVLPSAAPL